MAKAKAPSAEQIEAARKLTQKKAPEAKPAPPPDVVDPDPRPVEVAWNGKDADFPAWVAADMRYKEALSAWMARHKKA